MLDRVFVKIENEFDLTTVAMLYTLCIQNLTLCCGTVYKILFLKINFHYAGFHNPVQFDLHVQVADQGIT